MLPKNDCLNNWLGNAYLPQQFLAAQVCLCSHSHPCHTLWTSTSACVPVFLVKQDSRQPHTPENQWCCPEETEEDLNDTTVYSWQKSLNKTWIRNCQKTLLGTLISVPFRGASLHPGIPRHDSGEQNNSPAVQCLGAPARAPERSLSLNTLRRQTTQITGGGGGRGGLVPEALASQNQNVQIGKHAFTFEYLKSIFCYVPPVLTAYMHACFLHCISSLSRTFLHCNPSHHNI